MSLSFAHLLKAEVDELGTSFQIVALSDERFVSLFSQSDAQLEAVGARREIVETKPGTPCRVSLIDAEVGETVVLVPFDHHDVDSPYRATGPIFVRRDAVTARPAVGDVPIMFRHRLLSIRGYNEAAMMIDAEVVMGSEFEAAIGRLFSNSHVNYLHVHNAGPGCYNCLVERA